MQKAPNRRCIILWKDLTSSYDTDGPLHGLIQLIANLIYVACIFETVSTMVLKLVCWFVRWLILGPVKCIPVNSGAIGLTLLNDISFVL